MPTLLHLNCSAALRVFFCQATREVNGAVLDFLRALANTLHGSKAHRVA